ncbi:hypothetical protein CLOM_g11242 [Closterium sp. NIES-68]|nr:hypothetical protein CLOM_g11242 [Closterium sp. NIES-68]GJP60452.1 hypothetical protein CLOP_g17670 [Closterium sp. NIES-67]
MTYRHRDQEATCLAPPPISPFTPRGRIDEFSSRSPDSVSASLDRSSAGGSGPGDDSSDRLMRSSQYSAERSSGGSADGGSLYGSGSSHGSPSSASHSAQQHHSHRQQQGGFPPERRDPRMNRVVVGGGAVYAAAGATTAEMEYGYERYSHPGAKSGAIAGGGGNHSQVAPRGGSARANSLGRQLSSYDSPIATRASEYATGSAGYRVAAGSAGYSRAGVGTGSSSGLCSGAGGGAQSAGTRRSGISKMGDEHLSAERGWWGHSMNVTEGWWREGDKYARESACAAAGRGAVVGEGARFLTAHSLEGSRQAARVMAVLNAAAEEDEDAAHEEVNNRGPAGTGAAKTSHLASAKSVVAIMAVVIVVLVLLPACLSDVAPPPAELMLVPVVVMLLLLTLVLTPTVSSFPARSHP